MYLNPEEDDVSTVSCPRLGNETGREDFPVILLSGTGMGPGPQAEEGLEILTERLSGHPPSSPVHRSLRGNRQRYGVKYRSGTLRVSTWSSR